MKAFIQKIFCFLKSLFLHLRVIVTLQFGKDRVEEERGSQPEIEESQNDKEDSI